MSKIDINESQLLKTNIHQFLSDNHEHFEHLINYFDALLFLKDPEQKEPLEVFELGRHFLLLLPKKRYVIVAGESFNNLTDFQLKRTMIHVLAHIPETMDGSLKDHDTEEFMLERKLLFGGKDDS